MKAHQKLEGALAKTILKTQANDMSVTEVEIKGIRYLKVHRRWGDKTRQEYIPLPDGEKGKERAWKRARDLDADMANQQAVFRAGKALQVATYLRSDGKVVGITRPNGSYEMVARVRNRAKGKQEQAKASITVLGVEKAYLQVLESWIDFRHLERNGPVHQALKEGYRAYLLPEEAPEEKGGVVISLTSKPEAVADDLETTMQAQVSDFLRKRRSGVIGG